MKNIVYFATVGCLTLPLLQACGTGEARESARVQAGEAALPVEMTLPVQGTVAARLHSTTTLEADSEALVTARAAGEIRQIHVEEGDRVKAGDLLVTLDGERLRLAAVESRARLAKLEQEYRRQVELHEKGLVASVNFEDLKFSLDAERAAFKLAELRYSYTRITAPIDGVVTARLVKPGQFLNESDPVLQVTDPDSMIARIRVPQSELGKFALGQQATLSFDALPGLQQPAVVSRISPTVDPGTGTFRIQFELQQARSGIAAGMFARVQLAYDYHEDAMLLPSQAVIREDAETVVYVVDNGEAKRRVITVGLTDRGMTEVLGGLQHDDQVIVTGNRSLRDGTPVASAAGMAVSAG